MSTLPRLSDQILASMPDRPGYARDAQAAGIVHFGIGAFHRAHQAWYTDRAMAAGDRDWAILGVSMRSPAVAAQLNPQDGLYSVTTCSAQGRATEVVRAVRRVLVATGEAPAIIAAIASADTHIVSFTITEKGYCRAARGGIDRAAAEAGSIYPLLAEGLRSRRAAGLPGLTLLSCDNLANNGKQLRALLLDYVAADSALAEWIDAQCRFPCAMVDRIVPATTDADRESVAAALGAEDAGAVVTEPFSQWVIEDRFAGPRPRWEAVGAEIVADVAPYETAKLRMLNGAHSALAYLGLARGHGFVHEAVVDPAIRPLIDRLMREEALPTIPAAPGQDLAAYADNLLDRFANPALNHRLIQIAMDGSQKIPQRWLETLAENQLRGHACPSLLAAVAAWRGHLRGDNAARWGAVDDPMAAPLRDLARQDDAAFAHALFGPGGLFAAHWTADAHSMQVLIAALQSA